MLGLSIFFPHPYLIIEQGGAILKKGAGPLRPGPWFVSAMGGLEVALSEILHGMAL